MATSPNRVRERREQRGLSQIALAAAARVTRQSVGAIEAGRAIPGVDVALRIAQALDCRVEELFAAATEAGVMAECAGAPRPGRVALAQIGGRWIAYPLAGSGMRISADGLARTARKRNVEVEPVRALVEASANIVMMGCAAALGLLADRLNARRGPGRFLWLGGSSTGALEALAHERAHVAGVHLVDDRTGEANVVDVRHHLDAGSFVLITLASWESGLVTAPGNPKRIRSGADLGRRGLRLVGREPGSGARRLLERELHRAGLPRRLADAAQLRASGHLEVAQAVAIGAADAGIASRDAAIAFGLDFVALAEERYDVAIRRPALADPRLERCLETMTSAPFRRELSSLGYDVRSCGDRVTAFRRASPTVEHRR